MTIHSDQEVLAWLNVHIPRRRGLSRVLWRTILPPACRESLEEAAARAAEREAARNKDVRDGL